jgi:hypothetical protein
LLRPLGKELQSNTMNLIAPDLVAPDMKVAGLLSGFTMAPRLTQMCNKVPFLTRPGYVGMGHWLARPGGTVLWSAHFLCAVHGQIVAKAVKQSSGPTSC